MSGRASGKPPLTPAEEADLLPPTKAPAAASAPPSPPQTVVQSLLPPEIELPPGDDSPLGGTEATIALPTNMMEATAAWTAPHAIQPTAPPLFPTAPPPPPLAQQAEVRANDGPPPVMSQVRAPVRRLSPEEKAQRRLIKNAVLFGFFVVVLLVVFWAMANRK